MDAIAKEGETPTIKKKGHTKKSSSQAVEKRDLSISEKTSRFLNKLRPQQTAE